MTQSRSQPPAPALRYVVSHSNQQLQIQENGSWVNIPQVTLDEAAAEASAAAADSEDQGEPGQAVIGTGPHHND
jgi:hypothetical protein